MRGGPMDGVRVAEVGGTSLAYAGKVLSDLGAHVIKVEPPAGDPSRQWRPLDASRDAGLQGLAFNYHNAGKRSLALEFAASGDSLSALASTCDILLTDQGPEEWERAGASWEYLYASNLALVIAAITPFGLSGPKSEWNGSDLVALAAGGLLAQTGEPEGPPYQLAGSQAYTVAGAYGAANTLIALRAARRDGVGQVVDISLQEAVGTLTTLVGVPKMLADGVPSRRQRNGRASGGHPTGLYPTNDGLISISLARAPMWVTLAKWIHEVTGIEEVLDPMFEGSGLNRQQHADLIDIYIDEFTRRFSAKELFEEGQRRGLAFALVSTPASLLADEHFSGRDFWIGAPGEPGPSAGPPYRFSRSPWGVAGPVPAIGQHSDEVLREAASGQPRKQSREKPAVELKGALEGLRVVEFTVAGAGPWVGRHLSYHGAEVIRIESHGHPDFVRMFVPPWNPAGGVDPQASPWLAEWNAGKLNAGLNLRAPGGRDLARALCLSADIVIENHKPGFLEHNGLGYASLAAKNPRLVMMSMQGYGTWGPYKDYLSWGYNLEPMAGLSSFSGWPERPMSSPIAYPDWLAGLHGVIAIVSAIHERERSGMGQSIELAQVETAISTVGALFRDYAVNGTEPVRLGNRSLNWAPQGVYRGKDRPGRFGAEDTWLALSIITDDQWRAFCEVMGQPELAAEFASVESRLAAHDKIDRAIEAWMANRDVEATAHLLQERGIPAHLAQDCGDLLKDEHLIAREYFATIPHEAKGTETVTGLAGRFSGTPTGVPYSGGPIGGDNRKVFIELLGLSSEEFLAAVELGAIEEPKRGR